MADDTLTTQFEAAIAARGLSALEKALEPLRLAEPADLLTVALKQYAARGNAERLTTAAMLLTDAGHAGWQCLRAHVYGVGADKAHLYFFIDAVASSTVFSLEQRLDLLTALAVCGDEDTLERLDEVTDGNAEYDPVRQSIVTRREMVAPSWLN